MGMQVCCRPYGSPFTWQLHTAQQATQPGTRHAATWPNALCSRPHLAPGSHQQPHHLQVTPQGSLVQGGVAIVRHVIHVRVRAQQQRAQRGVPARGGVVQRQPPVGVLHVGVAPGDEHRGRAALSGRSQHKKLSFCTPSTTHASLSMPEEGTQHLMLCSKGTPCAKF